MQRPDGRTKGAMRPVKITTDYTMYAEGSVLVEMGNTKVICTASVEEKVPPFLEGKGLGWVTAEYAMLPRATNTRKKRDIKSLKLDGRSSEIQRLIGRALRAVVDREALGERQIIIDCDVIQADGGTRCASITGGFVALWLACKKLLADGVIEKMPLTAQVAAVSVGIFEDEAVLDLNYAEDSHAIVDCNVVMTSKGAGHRRGPSVYGYRAAQVARTRQARLPDAVPQAGQGDGGKSVMQFVLASHNKKKLAELSAIVSSLGIEIIPLPEGAPEPEENALIKAKSAAEFTGLPALADDSGLCVDALDGAPGIYSARYCEGTDEDRNAFLLKNMQDKENRACRFVCAIACVLADGETLTVRGECEGTLLRENHGAGGFGYDPLFYVEKYGCTFGELPAEVKNTISHRANALNKLKEALKDKI